LMLRELLAWRKSLEHSSAVLA